MRSSGRIGRLNNLIYWKNRECFPPGSAIDPHVSGMRNLAFYGLPGVNYVGAPAYLIVAEQWLLGSCVHP